MADRIVNGNTNTENGWRLVDEGSCVWVRVPGTNVTLQIREGQPAAIMGAFAADFNAYVEPLRDPDSACYTVGNSVLGEPGKNNGSNHMSATAMDLNWDSHPFQKRGSFNQGQLKTIQELLDFYENTIFWAGVDWSKGGWGSPIDEMHWQMGYDTYGSQNVDRVQDFINRKIRSDGFSTFRREGMPPPPPPPLSRTDGYALAVIRAGQRRNVSRKGICIALCVPPVETGWRNLANSGDPETRALPNDGTGADHDSAGLFQQRRAWGPAAVRMNPELSAGLFYDGGADGQRGLRAFKYDTDYQVPGLFAADVQQPDERYRGRYQEHWDDANALYDRLAGSAPPAPNTGDDMALVPQDQWDALFHAVMNQRQSRSPLRELDEGNVGDAPDQIWDMDGSVHVLVVDALVKHGSPSQLALLNRVANADPVRYPDRQQDRLLAQAILADYDDAVAASASKEVKIESLNNIQSLNVLPKAAPAEVPAVVEEPKSMGQLIGKVFDALEELRLADALPIEGRAPLAALIAVLNTKNGSQLS